MKTFRFGSYISLAVAFVISATSCNKDFKKVIPGSEAGQDYQYKSPKVLYLIVDGARGASVRDAKTPVLTSLLSSSIYSWASLADTSRNDATNWADMMTGVQKDKHQVLSDSFEGNHLDEYPVIFKRIKSVKPQFRIVSFASSDLFKEHLTDGADVSESYSGNDLAVKDAVVNALKNDTASIVVGQFSAVEKAGNQYGYDIKFPQYKAAIDNFDSQVGEIITALKARKDYPKEDWMIIVTSNRGGQFTLPVEQDDKTLFSNTNANTFTIFYSSQFKPTFVGKPYLGATYSGAAVRFKNNGQAKLSQANAAMNAALNFGKDVDFTVSIKVKKGKTKNTQNGDYYYEWPSIVGKRNQNNWDGKGWNICLFYDGWRYFGGGGTNQNEEIAGNAFSGDTWHDLTFAVETKANGERYIRMYTDGVKGSYTDKRNASSNTTDDRSLDRAKFADVSNNDPVTIGYTPGDISDNFGTLNLQLAELKIWRTALPDAVIKQYACDPTMDESHPNWNDLVGYWPMTEGTGDKFEDKGPFGVDFKLQGDSWAWESFSDLICTPANTNLGTLVPKNSDIPTQILSWFNIARQEAWGLQGRVWISN